MKRWFRFLGHDPSSVKWIGCGIIFVDAGLSTAAGGSRRTQTHDRRGGQPGPTAHAATSRFGSEAKYTMSGVFPP